MLWDSVLVIYNDRIGAGVFMESELPSSLLCNMQVLNYNKHQQRVASSLLFPGDKWSQHLCSPSWGLRRPAGSGVIFLRMGDLSL